MSSPLAKNETKEQKTNRLIHQAAEEIKKFVASASFGVLQIQVHLNDGQIDSLRVNPERSFK